MAAPLVDFCEQANPAILGEVRRAKFHTANRMQQSLLARAEKRALVWMAERTPAAINSDHLTVVGFLAQIMAGVSYVLAQGNRYWLLAGIPFLALNWLGDSLDGTLARVRQRLRPRYGFYVDHILDSFGAVALMGGLALSGYMNPHIAIVACSRRVELSSPGLFEQRALLITKYRLHFVCKYITLVYFQIIDMVTGLVSFHPLIDRSSQKRAGDCLLRPSLRCRCLVRKRNAFQVR